MPAHRFNYDFAKALIKALGLEGHRVRRIEIVADVREAVKVTIYEYSDLERSKEVVTLLEMASWEPATEDRSVATDAVQFNYNLNSNSEKEL